MTTPHLLVVDDDPRLQTLLQEYLVRNGYNVTVVSDGSNLLHSLAHTKYDLLILDIMLPGLSGFELTQRLRALPVPQAHIPILLLTAMGEANSRIEGFEKGADDYLTKPFEPKELLLRIQAILRRAARRVALTKVVKLGTLHFDLASGLLKRGEEVIALTSTEEYLLKELAKHEGLPVSREKLANQSGIYLSSRSVDVQITRLRKKIEENPAHPKYLRTIRHKGYGLWPDSS